MDKPAVVLDCGTGFLKMGLAGVLRGRGGLRAAAAATGVTVAEGCAATRLLLHTRNNRAGGTRQLFMACSMRCRRCRPPPQHAWPSLPGPTRTPAPPGDEQPRFVEPTVIAYHGAGTSTSGLRGGGKAAAAADPLADLDYSIGSAALANTAGSALTYPMRGGVISDFDSWQAGEAAWRVGLSLASSSEPWLASGLRAPCLIMTCLSWQPCCHLPWRRGHCCRSWLLFLVPRHVWLLCREKIMHAAIYKYLRVFPEDVRARDRSAAASSAGFVWSPKQPSRDRLAAECLVLSNVLSCYASHRVPPSKHAVLLPAPQTQTLPAACLHPDRAAAQLAREPRVHR